jgi:hypothetical protein
MPPTRFEVGGGAGLPRELGGDARRTQMQRCESGCRKAAKQQEALEVWSRRLGVVRCGRLAVGATYPRSPPLVVDPGLAVLRREAKSVSALECLYVGHDPDLGVAFELL